MKKATIVKADDWEGLFIDGLLVAEGHTLNQGQDRISWISEVSTTYHFDSGDVDFEYVTDEYYDDVLSVDGNFPENLSEVGIAKREEE